MTDMSLTEARRKLLKALVAGGGAVAVGKSLPESWMKPVIDSVTLPVHAQASGIKYFGSISNGGRGGPDDELCIDHDGGTQYDATYINMDAGLEFTKLFVHTPSQVGTAVTMASNCEAGGPFNVTSITSTEAFYNFDGSNTPVGSIPLASCVIPAEDCPTDISDSAGW
jgi:hypothetical protein